MLVTLTDFHQHCLPYEDFRTFLQEAQLWCDGVYEDSILDNYTFRLSNTDSARLRYLLEHV